MLSLLGQTHSDLGNFAQSINFQSQALELARRLGNRDAEAEALF